MNDTERIEQIKAAILKQNLETPFSGVIDLRLDGEVLLSQAFGYANLSDSIPNTIQTRFGMASGSKTFTSTAICQLEEQGKVQFDSLLKDCIALSLPQFDPAITLHQLLTHTSGIPDYFDEEESDDYETVWQKYPAYSIREPGDFLPLFAHLPMKFKPGERFSYSNSGFILLGLVVERLAGMPFRQYIEENIFKPAFMEESGYFFLDQLPDRTANGYIPVEGGGWKSNIFSIPIVGAPDGGAFTTVGDLAKYWEALFNKRLISPETFGRMFKPHRRTNPNSNRVWYGYGVWIGMKKGQPESYYMLGEDPGVAFYSGYFPNDKLVFTMMGNTSHATFELLETLLPIVRRI